jgi:hypothetical protein
MWDCFALGFDFVVIQSAFFLARRDLCIRSHVFTRSPVVNSPSRDYDSSDQLEPEGRHSVPSEQALGLNTSEPREAELAFSPPLQRWEQSFAQSAFHSAEGADFRTHAPTADKPRSAILVFLGVSAPRW